MSSKETVPNTALSGDELKQLLRDDFEIMLAGAGFLSHYMAFGRAAYDIRLKLYVDNPVHPEFETSIASRPIATNIISQNHPELTAIEAPPLADPSPDAIVSGDMFTREILSPNEERVRAGLPVPVSVKQQDGTITTEHIRYPKGADGDPGHITETDITEETRAGWGLPPTPQPEPTVAMAEVDNGDPT